MLVGVFGLIGSGKSLLLADIADSAIHHKKYFGGRFGEFSGKYERIYTNFPFCGAYRLDFDSLGVQDFSNALILIDEIQLYADSRNFRDFPDSLKNFLCLSRHYKCDIIYASQSWDSCDKKIRTLTEKLYHVSRGVCGFMKVQEIRKDFHVSNGTIIEGFSYAPQASDLFFRYRKLFGRIDSHSKFFQYSGNTSEYWDNIITYDFISYLCDII